METNFWKLSFGRKVNRLVKNPNVIVYLNMVDTKLLEAVLKKDYKLIKYMTMHKKYNDLCIYAIYEDIDAMDFIEFNDELNKRIIDIKPSFIQYIKNPSYELCQYAIDYDYTTIYLIDENVPNKYQLIQYANLKKKDNDFKEVRRNWLHLAHISESEQTELLCMEAVKLNARALQFCKIQTPEICRLAANKNAGVIPFIKDLKLREKIIEEVKNEILLRK